MGALRKRHSTSSSTQKSKVPKNSLIATPFSGPFFFGTDTRNVLLLFHAPHARSYFILNDTISKQFTKLCFHIVIINQYLIHQFPDFISSLFCLG